jgi:succinoglycan biosynthesis transport protein ExoP
VTCAEPGEGKSTVVANLAAAFAEMGHKVLTISCDFRRPKIHEFLGVANVPGLSDAIRNSNGQPILRDNVLKSSFHEFVGVVPSGSAPDKPGELLSSDGMRRALEEARQLADVVLIDSSPLLSAGDAVLLLEDVDAVLVVARAGQTHTGQASQTAGLLARLRAPVRGVVLTSVIGAPSRHDNSQGEEGSAGLRRGFSRLARHYSPL